MSSASEHVIDEVRDILRDAGQPLTRQEIYRRSLGIEAAREVSFALAELARRQEAEALPAPAGEPARFQLAKLAGWVDPSEYVEISQPITAPAEPPAEPSEANLPAAGEGISAKVARVLQDSGKRWTTSALASVLGIRKQQVSNALSYLQRNGQVNNKRIAGGVQREWWWEPQKGALPQKNAPDQDQAQEAPRDSESTRPAAGGRGRTGQAFSFCLWNDGRLEIWRGTQRTEALSREEVNEVLAYCEAVCPSRRLTLTLEGRSDG